MNTRGNAEYPCAVDGCPLHTHHGRICTTCAANLIRDLAEMPALLDDLSITLSRQARIGGRNGSRSAERPLPYDPRASAVGDLLRGTLVGWVRGLHDGAELWPVDSLHGIALWLYVRHDRLIEHPAAEEAVDEIGYAVRQVRQVVDRPPPRIYAGQCGNNGCTDDLYAKPLAPDVECRTCGTRHSVTERRETMRAELDGMLLTKSEIVRFAAYFEGVATDRATKLLHVWEQRRRITPHTILPDGHGLYPFGQILALLLATPARQRMQAIA